MSSLLYYFFSVSGDVTETHSTAIDETIVAGDTWTAIVRAPIPGFNPERIEGKFTISDSMDVPFTVCIDLEVNTDIVQEIETAVER